MDLPKNLHSTKKQYVHISERKIEVKVSSGNSKRNKNIMRYTTGE